MASMNAHGADASPDGGEATARRPPSPAHSASSDEDTCRVCREGDDNEELVAPCRCTGSTKWVHPSCLNRWRVEAIARNPRYTTHCEVCQHELDPELVPPTRVPPFAKAVANQGVRLALFTFVLLALVLLVGVLSVETAGRGSCFKPWHSVDERFLAMLLVGGAMVFAVDRIIVAAAYRTLSGQGAAALEAGTEPAFDHATMARNVATGALLVSLYCIMLGYAVTDFFWLVTASTPRTTELRFGNGFAAMMLVAGLAWAGRSACPQAAGARRATPQNLPAPLLGADGDGNQAPHNAGDTAEAPPTQQAALATPPSATVIAVPADGAGDGGVRSAGDVDGDASRQRSSPPPPMLADTLPRNSSAEIGDDDEDGPQQQQQPAEADARTRGVSAPRTTPPPALHEADDVDHM